MRKLQLLTKYIETLTYHYMKKEEIINKNMQWRLCDCTLDKGYCLCKTNNNEENQKMVE